MPKKKNYLDGDSEQAIFARVTYDLLMTGKWINHAMVMAKKEGRSSVKDLEYSISKCEKDGELKKAFSQVVNAIRIIVGDESIEERGNNRCKEYRYVEAPPDKKINIMVANLNAYRQFCQDSAGFFPISWIDFFFKDTLDLLKIKKVKDRGKQHIGTSLEGEQTNIDYLPFIYKAIVDKRVLKIKYKPFGKDERELTVHPHYLKEYNGRWHLFCHADNCTPEFGYDLALDRMQEKPMYASGEYIKEPAGFYHDYFKDIVGVSQVEESVPVSDVVIRAHGFYFFKLIETKPIHKSQRITLPYDEERQYGEFTLTIKPNKEFYGRILQKGAKLEIISPEAVRMEIAKWIDNMSKLYQSTR